MDNFTLGSDLSLVRKYIPVHCDSFREMKRQLRAYCSRIRVDISWEKYRTTNCGSGFQGSSWVRVLGVVVLVGAISGNQGMVIHDRIPTLLQELFQSDLTFFSGVFRKPFGEPFVRTRIVMSFLYHTRQNTSTHDIEQQKSPKGSRGTGFILRGKGHIPHDGKGHCLRFEVRLSQIYLLLQVRFQNIYLLEFKN